MLHPGVRLILWGAAAVFVQAFDGWRLAASACIALAAAAVFARPRTLRLLGRARWLLLALGLLFAFATPGRYVWPELGSLGPTAEGLELGAVHGARVLAVIALVGLLLETTPIDALVSGVHALLRPARRLGAGTDRLAVRLMLVLQYSESSQGRGGLRDWLVPEEAAGDMPPTTVSLERHSIGALDLTVLGIAGAALFWAAA
jgi:energy-coupling factor transporter transmembrane protein EcfT